MTTRDRDHSMEAEKPRDPDFIGAEVAINRAARIARRRAMENLGSVAMYKDGKVVWETPDGIFLGEPSQDNGTPEERVK